MEKIQNGADLKEHAFEKHDGDRIRGKPMIVNSGRGTKSTDIYRKFKTVKCEN
jgi:hypothetical protein